MNTQLDELCESENQKAIQDFIEEYRHELSLENLNLALRTAALTNNVSIAKYLITQGANCLTMALAEATSRNGTDDMIEFLLHQGADPHDWMAMENAIRKEDANAVQLLINAGFNEWNKALLSSVEFGLIDFTLLFLRFYTPTTHDLELYTQALQRHPNVELGRLLGIIP